MKQYSLTLLFLSFSLFAACQELYEFQDGSWSRWASFENPSAGKGAGGKENKGAKGHAHHWIGPGQQVELLNYQGTGIVERIWMTIDERTAVVLRSVKLEMFWDGATKPAVAVPLGDFFGAATGRKVPFESALLADPEGRSFLCYIPMPFYESARVVLTNESSESIKLFYDINFTRKDSLPEGTMYFHAYWHRERPTRLAEDFEILPRLQGKGRYLGTSVGVFTGAAYKDTWWGEGAVKIYLDGDEDYPTLVGTGTEDYIGTAWGQGTFSHRYSGSLVADPKAREWSFYRFHIPDPVYFTDHVRVTLQQMGGAGYDEYKGLQSANAPMIPVTVENPETHELIHLYENDTADISAVPFSNGWVNFFRQDDVAATAYFYLDRPESDLSPLAPKAERVAGMETKR